MLKNFLQYANRFIYLVVHSNNYNTVHILSKWLYSHNKLKNIFHHMFVLCYEVNETFCAAVLITVNIFYETVLIKLFKLTTYLYWNSLKS